MQLLNSEETVADSSESSLVEARNLKSSKLASFDDDISNDDDDSVLDVSGRYLDSPFLEGSNSSVKGLYIFRNAFNLIPKSVGDFRELRMLKFFGNEINLFPPELKNFVGLECLQVKLSSPAFGGLSLHKLKGLKELELSKMPPKPSSFPILSEIVGLKCLTKLSVCHFSIRFLPPEIGCLDSLEYLDLSFNKMKRLPAEIGYLSALISLRVANNKLVELPPALSSLQKLENLDLSSNRLTSLGSLELVSMHSLKSLNLQYNKFLRSCQIPSWICCNFEGNCEDDRANEDWISSTVEMDVYEATTQDSDGKFSHKGTRNLSSNLLMGSSTNSRSFASRRSGKRWRRRHYLQQKARQERLNSSRKWRGVDHHTEVKIHENHELGRLDSSPTSETRVESSSVIEELYDSKEICSGEAERENLIKSCENENFDPKKEYSEDCSSICDAASEIMTSGKNECCEPSESLSSAGNGAHEQEGSSPQLSKDMAKLKRYSERELDNPKPCKSRKPAEDSSSLSCKYNSISFCSIEDHLPDGFYDAGRDRPFMPLRNYEQNFHLDSREVILLNREHDEVLDSIAISAKSLMLRLKQINHITHDRHQVLDDVHIAQLLALFVSDHFGGSDRSAMVEKTRKAVSGSKYQKPFVCTCSTGDRDNVAVSTKLMVDNYEDILFTDICERSLRAIKASRNSIVVPLGALQFGVCRHRAVLLKYLCDRMEPPLPCELVRGYLDFMPHAWNVILVKRGNSLVRMVVDACRPNDIRDEADPEYFCRYIPLSRAELPISFGSPGFTFPSLSDCDEIEKSPSSSVMKCKVGSVEAAAKSRTLEVCESSCNPELARLQSEIKELLPHLGHREVSKVLLRCQSNFGSALAFFNWVKYDLNLRPNSKNYCLIIHILAWSRQLPLAMKFLSELIELSEEDVFQNLVLCTEHCNWNPVIFEMLIKAYMKVGMIQESYWSFKKMVRLGFVPSVIACNCILNGLAKMKCDGHCWELYEEMGRIGVHSNAYTFNILTYVLCRDGDVNKVNEFLEKMEEEGFDPDIVTYNTLIGSYCRRGRLEDAFHLYRIMYRRGVMPDLVSYTSLMNGLCQIGRVREAHQIFHRMIDRGLDPDVVSYNMLISAYCKVGRLPEARLLLHDMIRIGLYPDSFTCRIMVEGYGREGRLISALNLVVELQKLGVAVTCDIYKYLIISLCQEDRPFAAKSLLERIINDGFEPDAGIYGKLIESFCRGNHASEALLMKSEMENRNFEPGVDIYKSLICCLCEINRSGDGEGLMVEMVESGLPPDHIICRALINGHCKEGNADKAESLLASFAKEFQFFDTESFNALIKFYHDVGNETKLMELQDRMLKAGFVPNSLTCRYVIHGLWKSARFGKHRLQAV